MLKDYRQKLVNVFKLLCFILLVYNSFDIVFTYLSFDYNIKLMFDSNSFGTDLPKISVCTENTVLYDKNKVIERFKLRDEYKEHVRNVRKYFKKHYNDKELDNEYAMSHIEYKVLKRNYKLSDFFSKYQQIFENELNNEEREEFIVKANQLFECSAKVHFKDDSQKKTIDNCFDEFQISESFGINKDFGICYTFLSENYNIVLKDNDYLKIKIKYEIQKNFISIGVYKYKAVEMFTYSDLNFNTYFMITDDKERNFPEKYLATKVEKVGLKADLIIRKTSMETLSTPYMDYCENDENYNLTECFQNCIAGLISKQMANKDHILNSYNKSSFKDEKMQDNYCIKSCPRTCLQSYYTLAFHNIHHTYYEDSVINVKPTKAKNILYTAEVDMSLTQCVANIGGLLGLYLGLSIVDLGQVLKDMFRKLRRRIKTLIANISRLKLAKEIKYLFEQLLTYLKIFERIQWQMLFQMIVFPVIITQIFFIIDDYFSYVTESSVNFIPYNFTNMFSVDDFPLFTVCNDHILEDIYLKKSFERGALEIEPKLLHNITWNETITYNDIEKYIDSTSLFKKDKMFDKWNENVTKMIEKMSDTMLQMQITKNNLEKLNLYNTFIGHNIDVLTMFYKTYAKYFMFKTWNESMIMRQLVEDKNVNGINATLDMFRFYSYQFHTGYFKYVSHDKMPIMNVHYRALSPWGKCLTYRPIETVQYNFTFNVPFKTILLSAIFPPYLKHKIFIHSQKYLPIFSNDDNQFTTDWKRSNIILKMSKYEFERLGKPYDTHCQQYENSSQSKCLNDCYINQYITRFGCIPNHNKYHTIILDEEFINHPLEFCNHKLLDNITQLENNIQVRCNDKCDVPCLEDMFEAKSELLDINAEYQMVLPKSFYTKITYTAKVTFITLLINIVNTINFWHGTSFISALDILYSSSFISKIYIKLTNILMNYNLNFYQIIKIKIKVS